MLSVNLSPIGIKSAQKAPLRTETRPLNSLTQDIFIRNTPISMMGSAARSNPFEEDIPAIKEIIGQYKYGKIDLVDDTPEDFKIEMTPEKLNLHGYRNPDKNVKCGTCEELAYKAGVELQEHFGEKYIVMAVRGNSLKDHMTHYYLAVYENNTENSRKIAEFADKENRVTEYRKMHGKLTDEEMPTASKEVFTAARKIFGTYGQGSQKGLAAITLITKLQTGTLQNNDIKKAREVLGEDFIGKIQRIRDIQSEASDIQRKMANCTRLSPGDFEGALMVDPSFKDVKMFSRGMLHREYPQEELQSLEAINPFKETYSIPASLIAQPTGERAVGFAFGYVKDLTPELSDKIGGDTILTLHIKATNPTSASTYIAYTPKNSRFPAKLEAERLLGPEHKLTKFLEQANKR